MLSTLALAFAQPLGGSIADLLSLVGGGSHDHAGMYFGKEGDWDPKWREQAKNAAIGVAVVSFYGLDFAVNALVSFSQKTPPTITVFLLTASHLF